MLDNKFKDAILETFPLFDGELTRDTTAAEVPGWDSFGHVQLMFELEDRFDMEIEPQKALACKNIGELFDLLGK